MKKSHVVLLSSLLTLGTIASGTLAACGKEEVKKVEEIYEFAIDNDSTIGDVKITDLTTGEIVTNAKKDQILLVNVSLKNNDYEFKNITVNGSVLEWNQSYQGFIFTVSENNMQLKVNYSKLISKISINVPEEGIRKFELKKLSDNYLVKLDENNSAKLDIGEELELKVELESGYIFSSLTKNGSPFELNKANNTYRFTLTEEDLVFDIKAQIIANLKISFDEGAKITELIIGDKNIENPTNGNLENLKIGQKVSATFEIGQDRVLLEDLSGAFNDEDKGGGYKYDESIANIVKIDQSHIQINIPELPAGKSALVIKTRVAAIYEFEPFVGTWQSGKGNFSSNYLNYEFNFTRDGEAKITITDSKETYSCKGILTPEENGIIDVVFLARKAIYTKFVPILKEGKVTNYIVKMTGFINDVVFVNKDTVDTNAIFKTYIFNDEKRALISFEHKELNIKSWYYFSSYKLEKITVKNSQNEEIFDIKNDQEINYIIGEKTVKAALKNNQLIGENYWVGTYKNASNNLPDLVLKGDGNYTFGDETGTFIFDENKNIVTTKNSTFEEKTFLISTNFLNFDIYEATKNCISGLTFGFNSRPNESIPAAEYDDTYFASKFSFIDSESVHVFSERQIDEIVDYELSETGHFKVKFELVSGYRVIEGQFNENYTTLTFTKGRMIYLDDLVGVVAKVDSFDKAAFNNIDETDQNKLVLNSDFTYQLGETNSTYFIKYNEDGTITVRGEHLYKLNIVNGTYETLPDPIDYWFLNNSFNAKEQVSAPYEEAPTYLEARIEFLGDGKTVKLFRVHHYLYNYGGFDFKYEKEGLPYKYDKATHIIEINVEGTKVKLKEEEKSSMITFTHDFALYGKPYPYSGLACKIVAK